MHSKKIVLISGSSSGMGKQTALLLRKERIYRLCIDSTKTRQAKNKKFNTNKT